MKAVRGFESLSVRHRFILNTNVGISALRLRVSTLPLRTIRRSRRSMRQLTAIDDSGAEIALLCHVRMGPGNGPSTADRPLE